MKKEWRDFQWLKKRDKIPGLERTFKEMWKYYDLYLKKSGDLPYWSTEMALVANLAIAAVLLKYPAALEFYREGSRKEGQQRADLWLYFSSKQDLLIEAKRDWISVSSKRKTIADNIDYYFKQADRYLKNYIKKLPRRPSELNPVPSSCASIFFAQIYMTERDRKKPYPKIIRQLLRACRKAGKAEDASFYAYYFLDDNRNPKDILGKFKDSDNYYYPGIAIFGKMWKP